MDRVQGNLTNGTYIAICNMNKDNNVAKVEPKGNGFELLGTTDRNHENTGWHYESLGNDRYRVHSKKAETSFMPSTYAEGAPLDREREPNIFIVRETETKGEYFISYDEYPSWYICPMENGSGCKVSADPSQGRWSLFKVDD